MSFRFIGSTGKWRPQRNTFPSARWPRSASSSSTSRAFGGLPAAFAKKLKIRRTAVDEQLVELFAWGLVDRAAVFPPNGRPRIVYQVTQRGKDLLDLLERVVKEYTSSFKSDFARELEALEAKLAAGEIAEEMYFKRRKELEARYSLAL